ncbi:MAG: error-prone DNA polymerase [Gammaproteobacteria bacterium]|nr:error-prone DNA polymerase [Gammaproteobacteria bacterium]
MATSLEFAELYCRSNFSFLTGASHPEELVREAHARGYAAIAITDECSVAGAVRAHGAARDLGIKLIIGSVFRVATSGATQVDIVLLATNRRAYGQLCKLITQGRTQAPKGEYALHLDDFKGRADDCLALWAPRDAAIDELLLEGREVRRCCPRLWIGLGLFLDGRDLDRMAKALRLSMRLDLPITAANNVLMHRAERKPLLDTLAAIRLKQPVSELGTQLTPNAERHLRPLETLAGLYPEDMLAESVRIADACHFSLDELRYEYPRELVPQAMTPTAWLRLLTYEGAKRRWPGKEGMAGVPDAVKTLIEHELKLIAELGYEYYFLTIEDIVCFARSQGILCQGRGSAANSVVCYCLGITEVDPSRQHVLFERFISKERQEPPDIDVDFEHERREEVIQYIYGKYGRNRAALAATVITYRPRSALRDVGKALGLDAGFVDLLAKSMAWWDRRDQFGQRLAAAGADPDGPSVRRYIALVDQILGFPRHLSQHVGGFVISAGPLAQLVPIENAAMEERTVIQWDKNDLESLGLLKVDVLGLGMLTAIRKAIDLINGFRGYQGADALTMDRIPSEEASTYEMLQKGDSIGVFQVESRAQMAMLPRLRPERFYDLVIEVAIVRPGPIQGDMVHPYLRRRDGKEDVTYPNEAVRKVLERTLGVPIFQEQVIELAMVAAGFSAGEADELRRAMAAWQRRGGLEKFERKLIDGMLARGHSESFARRVFEQIKGFGEYGFPESHSASFALLVYNSAWLKRNEPAAFYAGLLNSLPMGFYSPSQLIQDALRHDIEVRPVDVQASGWDFRLEPAKLPGPNRGRDALAPNQRGSPLIQGALRIGLRQVKGLSEEAAARIAAAQPFRDVDDLRARAELNNRELGFLARSGALASLSGHRHQAHWDAAGVDQPAAIWRAAKAAAPYRTEVALAEPGVGENLKQDYRYLGLSLGPHPLSLLRDAPVLRRCRTAAGLAHCRHGQFTQVAGLITCRQRPGTATGVVFLTLEDETGNINVVVWSTVLDRYRAEILQGQLVRVEGVVQREREVIHVIAGRVHDATGLLAQLSASPTPVEVASRNFH